jgi:predicted ATPase/transcriptional regulator with XRE-family HTH domain
MSEAKPSFGALLRQLRTEAALSQEALAERAMLSRNAISDLERGLRQAPRLETVRLLIDGLVLGEEDRAALLAAARPALWERASSAVVPPTAAPLPVPLTQLIGRETELAALRHMLVGDHVRLLTITGPGGVGKTRFAIQAAANLHDVFPDGVWFVDLSTLTNAALVLSAVGAVLGMPEGEMSDKRLRGLLKNKRLLLVLDNFEHLLAAGPLVATLLAQAPAVKVLVTSRIPLHVYGEQEYPLSPLPLPDPSHLPPIERVGQYDAVRLFVARAQAVTPDFTLTEANAPAVAEICHRLDGLPLAIELAAARVKALPPRALLKRLEQQLPILTGGARTLPARQQTMRDTIAWSHDLLSPNEQAVFRRLAVFPGGCTIDAAEAVAGTDETRDVFDAMVGLVDGSLLRQEEGLEGEPRFRMLETVREFGLEQLHARGEGEATRNRLATWSLMLSQETAPDDYFGNMSTWSVVRVDEELPNLRAAITWLFARGEATRALRVLVAAEDYWLQRHITNPELHRWLETALVAAPDAPDGDRAIAHWLLSVGNRYLGNEEAALLHAQYMLAAATALGDWQSLGFAHVAMARAWENRGELAQAATAFAKANAAFGVSDIFTQAELGDILILQGDLESGVSMVDDALRRLRGLTDPPWFVVFVINHGGHAALRHHDLPRAAHLFTEAIDRARDLHNWPSLLSAMVGLAGVALARGQANRAAQLLGMVETARESAGFQRFDNWLHGERIAADTGAALEPADFARARAAGRAGSLEEAIAEALTVADEATSGSIRSGDRGNPQVMKGCKGYET